MRFAIKHKLSLHMRNAKGEWIELSEIVEINGKKKKGLSTLVEVDKRLSMFPFNTCDYFVILLSLYKFNPPFFFHKR